MVRVGGLAYAIDPAAKMGSRITAMTLGGKPIDAAKRYKVASWAPVSEEARAAGGEPIWDVVARWLRAQKQVSPRMLNLPKVDGVAGNAGIG
jgi:sulfur-oxidizing protein SoxB